MKKKKYIIRYGQDEKDNKHNLILEGNLGFENISSMKIELLSIGYKSGKTTIQLNNVETFDISSIQLILSIKKTLENLDENAEVGIEAILNEENKSLIRNSGFSELINT